MCQISSETVEFYRMYDRNVSVYLSVGLCIWALKMQDRTIQQEAVND